MRILLVLHDYLPRHRAGTELYVRALALELSRLGHEPVLLFTEDRPGEPRGRLRTRLQDGIVCHELARPHGVDALEESFRDAVIEDAFDWALDDIRPDVVHVHNLARLSFALPGRAGARGIPVVMTLHDYGLLCPRNARMRRADGTRCVAIEPAVCAACVADRPLVAAEHPRAGLLRRLAARLPAPAKRGLRRLLGARRRPAVAPTPAAPLADVETLVRARLEEARRALAACDAVVAPSRFLADVFARSGACPPGRVVHAPNGHDRAGLLAAAPAARAARDGGPLRVLYVGTVTEDKGVHVLVEAMNLLADRCDATCEIRGDLGVDPDYAGRLARRARGGRVTLGGAVERDELVAVMAAADVLVVPSLWWENAPLTIHEAFLAGTPVLASDIGGMAELVAGGRGGATFRAGDAADLARLLAELAADRGRLAALAAGAPAVRDIAEDAREHARRYEELAIRARSRATPPQPR